MSISNTQAVSDATATQAPGTAAATTTTQVASTTDVDTNTSVVETSAAPDAEATPTAAISDEPVTSMIEPAPPSIPNKEVRFNFTELSIVTDLSSKLATAVTNKDSDVEEQRHFFLPFDATQVSGMLNAWVNGENGILIYAAMDQEGTLKRPVFLGKKLGETSMAVIHVTGQIIYVYDQNNQMVGRPEVRTVDKFQPPAPEAIQTTPPPAAAPAQ